MIIDFDFYGIKIEGIKFTEPHSEKFNNVYPEKRQLSRVVRQFMKKKFGLTSKDFSLRYESFSGGNAYSLRAKSKKGDSVLREQSRFLKNIFTYGNFNGMFDIYEYKENRFVPQVGKFVLHGLDVKYFSCSSLDGYLV